MYLAADNTAVATATAERRRRRADSLSSFSIATALLSDWPATRVSATRAEAVPPLAGGTDKRIKCGVGHDEKGEANPHEEQKMWRGARERHVRICEERRGEEGGAPRRHRRGGRLVAQPTRQRRRDSHSESLKPEQNPGVLRRHSVLLLKQKTKRRRQSRRGEIVKKRRNQQRREHEAPKQPNINHRTPLPTLIKTCKRQRHKS